MRRLVPLVTLAALAVAGAPAAQARLRGAQTCAGAYVHPTAATVAAAQSAALCLVNAERRSRGLRPLRSNARLIAAARDHSRDMVRRRYFEHGAFVGRILAHGYAGGRQVWALGENLAWGTGDLGIPVAVVDAWMHSPGHRANILNAGFRDGGVGVASGVPIAGAGRLGGATYTLDFGTRR